MVALISFWSCTGEIPGGETCGTSGPRLALGDGDTSPLLPPRPGDVWFSEEDDMMTCSNGRLYGKVTTIEIVSSLKLVLSLMSQTTVVHHICEEYLCR